MTFKNARQAAIKLVVGSLLSSLTGLAQNSDPMQVAVWNQEHQLARAEESKDRSYFEHKLDDDLIYVAYDGLVFTKKQIVSAVRYIDVSRYSIENMKVRSLGPDAALATYDLIAKGSIAWHDLPTKQYASSIWVKSRGDWQLIFHQSTPATHH
jgi:hypothetical protein